MLVEFFSIMQSACAVLYFHLLLVSFCRVVYIILNTAFFSKKLNRERSSRLLLQSLHETFLVLIGSGDILR